MFEELRNRFLGSLKDLQIRTLGQNLRLFDKDLIDRNCRSSVFYWLVIVDFKFVNEGVAPSMKKI
jgi:hypothetical protein